MINKLALGVKSEGWEVPLSYLLILEKTKFSLQKSSSAYCDLNTGDSNTRLY